MTICLRCDKLGRTNRDGVCQRCVKKDRIEEAEREWAWVLEYPGEHYFVCGKRHGVGDELLGLMVLRNDDVKGIEVRSTNEAVMKRAVRVEVEAKRICSSCGDEIIKKRSWVKDRGMCRSCVWLEGHVSKAKFGACVRCGQPHHTFIRGVCLRCKRHEYKRVGLRGEE